MSQQPIKNESQVETSPQTLLTTRKQYITPTLSQYGELSRLTQGGTSGVAEAGGSSGNKRA